MAGLIVGILNQKGGSAKSTVTQNLSVALVEKHGKKVLIIDSDKQKTSLKWYAHRAAQVSESNDAAPAPVVHPCVISVEIAAALETNARAQADSHDIVFIDGAAGVDPITAAAVRASDVVIIPVQAALKDLESTADTVALIKQRQALTGGTPRAVFLVTRSDMKEKLTRDFPDTLVQFGFDVLDAQLLERSTHRTADLLFKTAMEFKPKSAAAADVHKILQELIENEVIRL